MHRLRGPDEPGRAASSPSTRRRSGRVAEVFGNLGKAERVSVVVPGVDTDLLTFQRTSRRYSAPVGMAQVPVRAPSARRARTTRTAVIAWADYTAPSGLGMDAATGIRAEDGAVRLQRAGTGAARPPQVALFCHSYGSVVCGVAAHSLPDRVADIAVAGSPGMRAEKAAQLHTSARVWAMRDSDDWIEDVPHLEVGGLGHGADPMSPDVRRAGAVGRGAEGHAGYFAPGTDSLRNFAEIGIGAYRAVRCARED